MYKFYLYLSVLASTLLFGCGSKSYEDIQPRELPSDRKGLQSTMNQNQEEDEWQQIWDERLAVLERELGKSDENIATSLIPIYAGGGADVLTFQNHLDGVAYVTAGLIGHCDQRETSLGQYELMMCFRDENEWAPSLLSKLAPYTFQAALNPNDTMEIGPALPEDATLSALLFVNYLQFQFRKQEAGILLCIGITAEELKMCQAGETEAVLQKIKEERVFPFTEIQRNSVMP